MSTVEVGAVPLLDGVPIDGVPIDGVPRLPLLSDDPAGGVGLTEAKRPLSQTKRYDKLSSFVRKALAFAFAWVALIYPTLLLTNIIKS